MAFAAKSALNGCKVTKFSPLRQTFPPLFPPFPLKDSAGRIGRLWGEGSTRLPAAALVKCYFMHGKEMMKPEMAVEGEDAGRGRRKQGRGRKGPCGGLNL